MKYIVLTVFTEPKVYRVIVGVKGSYDYIGQYANVAYCKWCKKHGVVPGKDSYYDYKSLGNEVEFLDIEVSAHE